MSNFSLLVCKVSLFHPLAAKQGKLEAFSATRHKLRLLVGGKKHGRQSFHVPSFCFVTGSFIATDLCCLTSVSEPRAAHRGTVDA